jgi:hypothetical protein
MELFMEYWYIILAAVVMAVVGIVLAVRFFKQPSSKQVAKVKEWLLMAVLEAEKQFGSGTGKLKLRSVYDWFVARFPWIAKIVSFETFAQWVDEALDTVEQWLTEDAIAEYVEIK